jgi:hypothetical protein|tara:strand:+ start:782 stop:1150 length:369 start_codon:yes stop_codon:yes gene_type:complete
MNYNEEVTTHIVNEYNKEPSTETVQKLSEELGKSTKSIIGKLSREGVYQRATYKNKTGELPVTKVELVNNIAENLGIEVENLLGLEKAPKATLKYLDLATGIQETEKDWREGTVWERSIDPS